MEEDLKGKKEKILDELLEGSEELKIIKSVLESKEDESTLDMFKVDLFSPETLQKQEEKLKPLEPSTEPLTEEGEKEPKPTSAVELTSESLEEVIEKLEVKAEVGEISSVQAALEKEKLEWTQEQLKKLTKMGDDFMNTLELKKLFQNVNIMIELLKKLNARIDELEKRLEKKIEKN